MLTAQLRRVKPDPPLYVGRPPPVSRDVFHTGRRKVGRLLARFAGMRPTGTITAVSATSAFKTISPRGELRIPIPVPPPFPPLDVVPGTAVLRGEAVASAPRS